MEKARLKLYVKGKRSPLFVCDIEEKAEEMLKQLVEDLNSGASVIRFGQIAFRAEDFRRLEMIEI